MKDVIIEEVIKKKARKIGNSCHIILPKKYENRIVYVLVLMENIVKPKIHYNRKKVHNGKTFFQGEITTAAGSHAIWIEKDKIKEIFKR